MNVAFHDYFRCPDTFGDFGTTGEPSSTAGYFRFDGVTGFGRLAAAGGLSDQADVTAHVEGKRVRLPFDPAEIVDNLREERYAQSSANSVDRITAGTVARAAYYFIRPILPVAVRKHLQRVRLSGWEGIPFPHWPVDLTIETLMQRLVALDLEAKGVDQMPFIWFWPNGAESCAILTHDIEAVPGRDFCDALMDLDDEHGIKASFQIVPEKRYPTPPSLFDSIRARGFEVNVHDLNHDGQLFQNRRLFVERVARINDYARQYGAVGFRAAAMYRNERWFGDLNFSYDMSVPNVAHLEPQRGGCCTVMPYFIGDLVELPLTTVQDYSLFHIIGDYSIALWKTQINTILAQHGLVTLLSHPDYLIDERPRRVYSDLLAHVAAIRDAGRLWVALPRDVAAWWRERRGMRLVSDAGRWRVEGPGSERACVAFATRVGGGVKYRVERAAVQAV